MAQEAGRHRLQPDEGKEPAATREAGAHQAFRRLLRGRLGSPQSSRRLGLAAASALAAVVGIILVWPTVRPSRDDPSLAATGGPLVPYPGAVFEPPASPGAVPTGAPAGGTPEATPSPAPRPSSVPRSSRSNIPSSPHTAATSSPAVVTLTEPGDQTSTVGVADTLQLQATDNRAAATFTFSATGLPHGLTMNGATGLITGNPTTAGTYSTQLTVRDSFGASDTVSLTWLVEPAPAACPNGQLLGNPGFETGSAPPWTATDGVVDNATSRPAHTGVWKARLGGHGEDKNSSLAQRVTLPTGCASYVLQFWLRIDTDEADGVAYDTLRVRIRNSTGSLIRTVGSFDNTDASSSYILRTVDLSAHAGQTVTIEFFVNEDFSLQTSFLVDDAVLDVS